MLILLFATDLQLVNVVSEAEDATVGILLGIPIGLTGHPLTDTAAQNPGFGRLWIRLRCDADPGSKKSARKLKTKL